MSKLVQTRLHETADVGSNVLELLAVDGDFGENGRVTYSIVSGNIGNAFSMDETLGMIKVARKLDLTIQVIKKKNFFNHKRLKSCFDHMILYVSSILCTNNILFVKQLIQ